MGVAAYIIPIMIPTSNRVSEETVQMIFEFLMSHTLVGKDVKIYDQN